jgi:hypothetical protein
MKKIFLIMVLMSPFNTLYAAENIYTEKTNGIYVSMKSGNILIVDISDVAKNVYGTQKYPLQIGDQIIGRCNFEYKTLDDFKKPCAKEPTGYTSYKIIRNGEIYYRVAKDLNDNEQKQVRVISTAPEKKDSQNIDEELITEAKNQCKKIGFKTTTSDYNNCVLKIYTTKIDKQEKSPIVQQTYIQSPTPQVDQDSLKRQEAANQEALRLQRAATVMQYLNNMKPYQLPMPQVQQPVIPPIRNTHCTTYGNDTNCTTN